MSNNQISTATNITGPDLSGPKQDARKYFNNFYSNDFSVGAADDVILSFFENYTKNKTAAKNLAASVLYTAKAQNIDPLVILNDFQKMPAGQINAYLAAFLNANRTPTSVIGIKESTSVNPLVSRTILL